MSEEILRNNLKKIFSKKQYVLSEVFHCIYEFNAVLPIDIVTDISSRIAKSYLAKLDSHEGEAKIYYINDTIDEFKYDCSRTIVYDFNPLANEELKLVARNVLALFQTKFEEVNGVAFEKRTLIQLNCETTTFLNLIQELSKEFFATPIKPYRISQLVADNFSDKKGNQIERSYCESKFSTSIGNPGGNEKLRLRLEKILKGIPQ